MKQKRVDRSRMNQANRLLEDGLTSRCVCGAKVTLVQNASGSNGFLHAIPACAMFERTGVPFRTLGAPT